MSRSLEDLNSEFRLKAQGVLADCFEAGYEFRPFFTLRDPWEQARLWRQSRSRETVEAKCHELRGNGAPFLAAILFEVGPQNGRWATNAIPGYSWHQWGEAMDCFLLENGDAMWDAGHNGYIMYATMARQRDLTCGRQWIHHPDPVHIQARPDSVRKCKTMVEVEIEMLKQWAKHRERLMVAA